MLYKFYSIAQVEIGAAPRPDDIRHRLDLSDASNKPTIRQRLRGNVKEVSPIKLVINVEKEACFVIGQDWLNTHRLDLNVSKFGLPY